MVVSAVCPVIAVASNEAARATLPAPVNPITLAVTSPVKLKFLEVASTVAVSALPVTSPVKSPTNAVDVIDVAPVTTPPSILIVPSSRMAEPAAGSMLIPAPASRVITPAESISTVPSAVICMLAAAAAVSVVTIDKVPLVPTVNTAVSSVLPVIVMTLPSTATSSTVRAVKVPNDVILVWAALVTVAAVPLVLPVTFPVMLPTKAVLVIEVAPVTTPASTTIAPSRTIC